MNIETYFSPSEILSMIKHEMEIHPESDFYDYYKLLFQASFGQGHFIDDYATARKYLIDELTNYEISYMPLIQNISNGKGVYRFSLRLITDDHLSIDDYLAMFTNISIKHINWIVWSQIWNEWFYVINSSYPDLINSNQNAIINELIDKKKICSHSNRFRLTYKPHYRVMIVSESDFNTYPFLKELI